MIDFLKLKEHLFGYTFQMRPRISIRGTVHLSVNPPIRQFIHPSVCPVVYPSVRNTFSTNPQTPPFLPSDINRMTNFTKASRGQRYPSPAISWVKLDVGRAVDPIGDNVLQNTGEKFRLSVHPPIRPLAWLVLKCVAISILTLSQLVLIFISIEIT